MRGIGPMARESGLTVSALRFYDRAGVLVPARVDPQTNYRWYSDEQVAAARLVARLRRVGLPVADIARVLGHRHDRTVVDTLLGAHLTRLEEGLADARRALATVRALLDEETPVPEIRLTVPTGALTAALRAVRPAAGCDPDLPMLVGVLLDSDGETVQVAATDRYRLAVATVVGASGSAGSVLLPLDLVDALVQAPDGGVTSVTAADGDVTVQTADRVLTARTGEDEFPDYRPLLRRGSGRRVAVDADRLRRELVTAPARTVRDQRTGADRVVSVLGVAVDGGLVVGAGGSGPEPAAPGLIGVDREFLLQALDATGPGQLELELTGPIAPLAVRDPRRDADVVLLMPVLLG